MEEFYTLIVIIIFMLNSIKLGSQSRRTSDRNPDSGSPLRDSPHSPTRLTIGRTLPSSETSLRARTRSPPARHVASFILGFPFEQLPFIRLIPHNIPHRVFQIRRYTFPENKPLELRGKHGVSVPMPSEERIVLTASTGDVLAMLERNNTVFRGIYMRIGGVAKRSKININSGEVSLLSRAEYNVIPAGNHVSIIKNFKVVNVNEM